MPYNWLYASLAARAGVAVAHGHWTCVLRRAVISFLLCFQMRLEMVTHTLQFDNNIMRWKISRRVHKRNDQLTELFVQLGEPIIHRRTSAHYGCPKQRLRY